MKKKKLIFMLLTLVSLLTGCTQRRMQYAEVLDRAEQQNADFDSITNIDSIKLAVNYIDTYGSTNERIRAHYLLGCAYRDMGEAPLALESYQDAADCADTTKADCDYMQLIKVYGQTANLFYQQLLPYEQLAELEQQYKYAVLSKDTLMAINAIEHKAGVYELLNNPDSIINTRLSAYKMYKEIGRKKEAASALGPIIMPLLDVGRIEEAMNYQNIYESESGIWEECNIDKQKTLYYFTKGKYYLAIEKIDSAKVFFYRLLSPDLTDNHWEAGYRGLYLLYKKTGQKDSLAKYADLCYQLNDASYASEATEKMQQMQSLYNYTRSQKEANEMKVKADHNWLLFMAAVAVLFLVLSIASYIYQKRQKEAEILQLQYENTKANLEKEAEILHLKYENTKANLEKAKREQKKLEEENSSLLKEKNQEILVYEQQIREYEAQLRTERTKVTNEELMATPIYNHFKFCSIHTIKKLHRKDWKELRNMIDEKIPSFYSELHTNKAKLTEQDYNLCILIRLYFKPLEISTLTDLSSSHISMKRIRLLKRIYGIDGTSEEFDKRIQSIF